MGTIDEVMDYEMHEEYLNKDTKKYKVTLQLMKDPTKGDQTFDKSYEVEASSESKAYSQAKDLQSADSENIRHRSVFSYSVEEIEQLSNEEIVWTTDLLESCIEAEDCLSALQGGYYDTHDLDQIAEEKTDLETLVERHRPHLPEWTKGYFSYHMKVVDGKLVLNPWPSN